MSNDAGLLAPQFATRSQQHEAATLGMWIFLSTELLVFGGLFTGYATYYSKYPEAFAAGSARLNLTIGAINTVVLLTSSLTMALAVRASQLGSRRALIGFLALTALLGAAFLALKAVEYRLDYVDRLMPPLAFDAADWNGPAAHAPVNPRHVELFLACYYFATLLHALHLIVGISVLTTLIVLAQRGRFSAEYYTPVEVGGLYWHFVDLIWIFLLPMLYLLGTHGPLR